MYIIEAYGKKILVNDYGYPMFRNTLPRACNDIVQFDLDRIKNLYNRNHVSVPESIDILSVGYWIEGGEYIQPLKEYSEISRKIEVEF